MEVPITVRPAKSADLEAVGRITVNAYVAANQLEDGPQGLYGRVLGDAASRLRKAVLLVAVRNDAIVGTVTLCPLRSPFREIAHDDEMEFRFLAVDPSVWGAGISDALIDACQTRALEAGSARLVIGVRDTNVAAQSLYARHGFVRLPDRDWRPAPEVLLLGYQRMVGPTGLEPMTSSL